ncbi:hypothetical protein RFI_26998 [Reticulomyxa filosa]|uniref:Glycosyl transferase 64 domain-containing protein n=1 Tax=Reticulomyxa filosa TaxID=46433 RepID=X6M939_RETFI|nr:hypothetical protein RFI_26998 [Reticulomyxa filosa]|eukprot:ETO10379.1 hypothetical protein RFI_26998 [Reticulomyxa filosa]
MRKLKKSQNTPPKFSLLFGVLLICISILGLYLYFKNEIFIHLTRIVTEPTWDESHVYYFADISNRLQNYDTRPYKDPTPMSPKKGGYTVVMNTFRRPQCIYSSIQHWRDCAQSKGHMKYLRNMIIIWPDPERHPEQRLINLINEINNSSSFRINIHRFNDTKLSNRYCPGYDDMLVECETIDLMYQLWIRYPDHLIGTQYRYIQSDGTYSGTSGVNIHPFRKYNNIFVTKGGFIHKKYYELYFKSTKFQHIRQMVDRFITGEDILMSAVYHDSSDDPSHVPLIFYINPPTLLAQENDKRCVESKFGDAAALHKRTSGNRATIVAEIFKLYNNQNPFPSIWYTF